MYMSPISTKFFSDGKYQRLQEISMLSTANSNVGPTLATLEDYLHLTLLFDELVKFYKYKTHFIFVCTCVCVHMNMHIFMYI